MIITIDGQIATGKSTIAKKLAKELGYIYFDTGAMYRCLTYQALKKDLDVDNPADLETLLTAFNFDIKVKLGERRYFVDKEDVTSLIRGEEVTSHVSKVSAIPQVRDKMVAMQRQFAVGVNAVFEGRDMGTVVFPHADMKVFLTGRPDIRAKRRYEELKAAFPVECENLSLEKALEDINARDTYDMTRETSPLRKADDAFEIDTSDLSVDEVVMRILELKDTRKSRPAKPGSDSLL
jgi:cytidylate kinase